MKAKIEVQGNPEKLFEVFSSEARDMPRSSLKIKKGKDKIVFDIIADDATAMRATINTVMKLIMVHEKMKL